MVVKIGGFRKKTRHKLRKTLRQKGKISLRRYLQVLKVGDVVSFNAEPGIQSGMYFPRYHGKKGKVIGQRGTNYIVFMKDGGLMKKIIVHPVHLHKLSSTADAENAKASAKAKK